jgi:hypothetical protein
MIKLWRLAKVPLPAASRDSAAQSTIVDALQFFVMSGAFFRVMLNERPSAASQPSSTRGSGAHQPASPAAARESGYIKGRVILTLAMSRSGA